MFATTYQKHSYLNHRSQVGSMQGVGGGGGGGGG